MARRKQGAEFVFTVEGDGRFPVDMLRYDGAWPKSEGHDSPGVFADYDAPKRRVVLVTTRMSAPGYDRWASFGWTVVGEGELRDEERHPTPHPFKAPAALAARPMPLTFHHSNGWTMSVAHNIGGPGYSVVAYPTADGSFSTDNAFTWEGGHRECWCSSLSSLVTDAQEVLNALPPGQHVNPPVTNEHMRRK